MARKILNNGRTIEGLPARAVLEHEEIPGEIADAVASWRESLEDLEEAKRAHGRATRKAGEETLQVRGERERWAAEVEQKTREEAAALRAAEIACRAAARVLVEALDEHADEVRRISALLALESHRDAVEAALSLGAARARFAAAGGARFGVRPDVDRGMLAVRAGHTVQEGPLDDLDRVDAFALAEAAGTRLDLVEVRQARGGVTLLTSARRARALVGTGSTGWSLVEDGEV
jgi:hypothetical protein